MNQERRRVFGCGGAFVWRRQAVARRPHRPARQARPDSEPTLMQRY